MVGRGVIPITVQRLFDRPLPLIGPAAATSSSLIGPQIPSAHSGSDCLQVKRPRWSGERCENGGITVLRGAI